MQVDRPARPGYLNVIERATSLLWAREVGWPWGPGEPAEFTCDSCAHAPFCTLAYDLLNTDGYCLASK